MTHYTKMLSAAVAMAAVVALGGSTAAAGVDAKALLKCQQTITKETDKFVKGKAKTLQKCMESIIIKDKEADPGPGARLNECLTGVSETATKTQEKIGKSISKLKAAIETKCCGKDKTCGDGTGKDADCALADIGFGGGVCPAAGNNCNTISLSDPGDVADCIECAVESYVDASVALVYDDLLDLDKKADKDEQKCQAALSKNAMKYMLAKHKELAKCWDARFKGKHGSLCPTTPDGKTAEKIGKSELNFAQAVCKACGGEEKACENDISTSGGDVTGDTLVDDFDAADLGVVDPCPQLFIQGTTADSIEEIFACYRDSIMDAVDCSSALSAPTLAGGLQPKCLPSCTGTGGTVDVDVDFSTSGATPAGTVVVLTYDGTLVDIPGTAQEPSVAARVTDDITGDGGLVVSTQPNDNEDHLVVAQSDLVAYPGSNLFTVEFDTCGAVPTDSNFTCTVTQASDSGGAEIPAGTVTCSATVL